MAEARSVITSLTATQYHSVHFDVHDEGITIHIPRTLYTPRLLGRAFARHAHRLRNRIQTALWPLHPILASCIVVLFVAYVAVQPLSSWWRSGSVASALWNADSFLLTLFCPQFVCVALPVQVRVAYLAAVAAFLFISVMMILQRIFLRVLLHYRGWLFERRPGILTKLWAVMLRGVFIVGRHPLLYSFQHALPRMTPPSVASTMSKLLASVRPVLDDKEYAVMESQAKEFQSTVATKLNTLLYLKSWVSSNYVSDWWLKYVYLRGRSPLLIQSNYYGCGFAWHRPTRVQAARAAVVVHRALDFFRKIDRETVEPMLIRGTVPLCMAQYKYLFSTTRVPGKECDTLRHYDSSESKHIVVFLRGVYYSINVAVVPPGGRPRDMTAAELQVVFTALLASVDHSAPMPTGVANRIAALTTMERTAWATARESHFSHGPNKVSLDAVERSVFTLALDQYVVFANGAVGLHAEHAWGDAPVAAHLMEHVLLGEVVQAPYDEAGNVTGFADAQGAKYLPTPAALRWDVTPQLAHVVDDATVAAQEAIGDLDLEVMEFNDFGKGALKKQRIPPDGFIQNALQLAFYRDSQGVTPLTYESAMTRMFRNGRTETIRSVSDKSKAFVEAMENPRATPEERLAALRTASEAHQTTSRHAMSGQGIDRHLFALYVMGLGMGYDVSFLKKALSMPWLLSTSQLPQRQTTIKVPTASDGTYAYASPSGGFGPVSDEGYGVSYMLADDGHTFFHVSSKRHCTKTSSKRFVEHLNRAFHDMAKCFAK